MALIFKIVEDKAVMVPRIVRYQWCARHLAAEIFVYTVTLIYLICA